MSVIIKSGNLEKKFETKTLINVGTNKNCDFVLDVGYELLLTVQYNADAGICQVTNNFRNPNILFKGAVLTKVTVDNVCRFTLQNSDEFIEIRVVQDTPLALDCNSIMNLSEADMRALYGDDAKLAVKAKIEQAREPIEKARVAIVKQIAFPIAELKAKILASRCASLILHISLYITSVLSSFAVANYLMGLSAQESAKHVYLATNIQVWMAYSFIVFAICLMLKQGIYLYLHEKMFKTSSAGSRIAKNFMLWASVVFILGIYFVNQAYYMTMSNFLAFAVFITFFFVGIMTTLAISCGYFKANGTEYGAALNKYEFREDFESVIKAYRIWIDRYVNGLSSTKIKGIKDRLFFAQLKSAGEVLVGLLTAPFLAYGVSNTLAMCFSEAAGWVRISGLRFSPVFLVLATCLIIFAFFAFVSAFLTGKKIQASQVIKQDGFSDYRHHGVTIFGPEGIKKLEQEKKLFLTIACAIVFIEFIMNTSYFMTEIGGEIKGLLISIIAALVPTALLVTETVLLSSTRFDVYSCEELLAKLDKE